MTLLDAQIYLNPRIVSPTTALLLDVENFCLKLDLEQYLKAYCQHPITIKLAVGNWQSSSIANLDSYLHKQRYQLIHVPQGKNAADAQILTLGSSLLVQYPQIKEVVIASHDSIFDFLYKTLISLGCNVYQVYQNSGNVHIHNYANNRTDIIKISNVSQTNTNIKNHSSTQDTQAILTSKIESIICKMNNNSSKDEVSLNILAQEYQKEYNKPLSKVIKNNKLGTSIIKFLKNNCSDKINIEQKNNIYYLSLK